MKTSFTLFKFILGIVLIITFVIGCLVFLVHTVGWVEVLLLFAAALASVILLMVCIYLTTS
jgi:hypothetical protein